MTMIQKLSFFIFLLLAAAFVYGCGISGNVVKEISSSECLGSKAEDALRLAGNFGGKTSSSFEGFIYVDGEPQIRILTKNISVAEVETELRKYLENVGCRKVEVNIGDDYVEFTTNGQTAKKNVKLAQIISMTNEIHSFEKTDENTIDTSVVESFDLYLTVFPIEEQLIYVIKDKESQVNGEPYQFWFSI